MIGINPHRLFMSTLLYMFSLCGIIVMYALYASKPSCTLNIFFITWTAILLLVMMILSLHSKVNKGLLSSGIMACYIVFLCWSALRSEPANEICSPQKRDNKHVDWMTVLGFLIGVFAIVMATFSTGIDSQTFQLKKQEQENKMEDDIQYKYGFFHLIFSLGAMYFAMLFISWNLDNSTRKWSIDVGWASTWVKIVNEWFAATSAGSGDHVFEQSLFLIFAILVDHSKILSVTAVDPATSGGSGDHVFELYMHDILGGSNPTARPVTGLLGNIDSGQVPLATRIGFRAPQGGVDIPNANGAIPTVNAKGFLLGTGLVGPQFPGNVNQNNVQNQIAAQLGPDGLGTITVIDDLLTIDSKLGSQSLGKAQGVYVASSADGSRQMMTFTAMMEGGEYGDSINFFGVYHIGSTMFRLSVTVGTGKLSHACGFGL